MNFDFGEVLSHAWLITWKQKVLWVIGLVFGFFIALMFPLMLSPLALPLLIRNSRTEWMLVGVVGFFVVFFLFMLILYPLSVLTQISLTLGVLDAENGEHSSVQALIQRSLPFFWRVLGLMLLFALGITLLNLLFQAVVFLLAIMTFGLGTMCIMPLTLLYYPFLYGSIVWQEQALNSIIIGRQTVMDAARQSWNLLRNNLRPVILVALIVYFGVGMITGVAVVPLMLPLFALPFGFMEHDPNWIIVLISILSVLVFVPIFAVIMGWSMIFTKSAWVLTYLRLTHNSESQPQLLPQGATS